MNKKYFIYLIFISSVILFVFSAQKALAQTCPNAAGNYTLTSSCVIPSGGYMVIKDGNLTINAGVTLTIDTNGSLIISPGYSIYPNGAIAMSASGTTIKKKTTPVLNNYATGNHCAAVCSNSGYSCAGIGFDSNATNKMYQGASVCAGAGTCSDIAGDCSTVMSDQCPGAINAACCGIDVYWTRCLCVTP